VADLTLNYAAQKAAVYENRFPSTSPVNQWLAAAYTDIWNAAPWPFAEVGRENWYLTADGTAGGTPTVTPKMPTTYGEVRAVYDDQGSELDWLTPYQFDSRYAADTSTGRPAAFKVVNRQITLWPTPTSGYLFTLSYRRRLYTRTSVGAVQAGFYQDDADLPAWDDHHYILVMRAKIIGLHDRSDPTASDLEGEYQRLLAAMIGDYVDPLPRGYQLPAWRP